VEKREEIKKKRGESSTWGKGEKLMERTHREGGKSGCQKRCPKHQKAAQRGKDAPQIRGRREQAGRKYLCIFRGRKRGLDVSLKKKKKKKN